MQVILQRFLCPKTFQLAGGGGWGEDTTSPYNLASVRYKQIPHSCPTLSYFSNQKPVYLWQGTVIIHITV